MTLDSNSPTTSPCTFTATAVDSFGIVPGIDVEWVTSDSQAASLEETGPASVIVTGRKAGSVTIESWPAGTRL